MERLIDNTFQIATPTVTEALSSIQHHQLFNNTHIFSAVAAATTMTPLVEMARRVHQEAASQR
jgi:hypothetical protein